VKRNCSRSEPIDQQCGSLEAVHPLTSDWIKDRGQIVVVGKDSRDSGFTTCYYLFDSGAQELASKRNHPRWNRLRDRRGGEILGDPRPRRAPGKKSPGS
jgi:hypothetical protein